VTKPVGGARSRSSFAGVARAALEKHLPAAREPSAHWTARPNLACVRLASADGSFLLFALRRHLGWVTGEAGIARDPVEIESLPLLDAEGDAESGGYRVRLGDQLGDGGRWWPAGTSEQDLRERLEWIVLQLRVKATAYFARHPLPRRREAG